MEGVSPAMSGGFSNHKVINFLSILLMSPPASHPSGSHQLVAKAHAWFFSELQVAKALGVVFLSGSGGWRM